MTILIGDWMKVEMGKVTVPEKIGNEAIYG